MKYRKLLVSTSPLEGEVTIEGRESGLRCITLDELLRLVQGVLGTCGSLEVSFPTIERLVRLILAAPRYYAEARTREDSLVLLYREGQALLEEAVPEDCGNSHPTRGSLVGVSPDSVEFLTPGGVKFLLLRKTFRSIYWDGGDLDSIEITVDFGRWSKDLATAVFQVVEPYEREGSAQVMAPSEPAWALDEKKTVTEASV